MIFPFWLFIPPPWEDNKLESESLDKYEILEITIISIMGILIFVTGGYIGINLNYMPRTKLGVFCLSGIVTATMVIVGYGVHRIMEFIKDWYDFFK